MMNMNPYLCMNGRDDQKWDNDQDSSWASIQTLVSPPKKKQLQSLLL